MSLVLPVKHFKQQSNWDCGITCLRMLINYYHDDDLNLLENLLKTYQCNQSTWTIDLLHLLHQLNIQAYLYTLTVGCSVEYDHTPYYENLIGKDRERVEKLFLNYSTNVKLKSVEWLDLKKHLDEQQIPCLVLIDANKLHCSTCNKSKFHQFIDKILSNIDTSYQGHYILVIGYETKDNRDLIHYVDPGKTDGVCTTTQDNFDLARKSFGTDEDIILCYRKHLSDKDTFMVN